MSGYLRAIFIQMLWALALLPANAQFKVIGPPPYSPPVARQQIRTLLERVDPSNRPKTVETLTGLLAWYRDIVDDELIAAWQRDTRANLTDVVQPLADSRVALAIIGFSWRDQRRTAFDPGYAPMFVNLMTRFPESAQPFLNDLTGATGQQAPNLSQPEAETVCRILLDMPDIGTWRKSALQILPHYRPTAERLLREDLHGNDQDKTYQAQRWLADLKIDVPGGAGERYGSRINDPFDQRTRRRAAVSEPSGPQGPLIGNKTGDQTPSEIAPRSDVARPSIAAARSAPAEPSRPAVPVPSVTAMPPPAMPYNGVKSGTFESSGGPIPQNAEYVFRDVPPMKIQLDYDSKIWEARLVPGAGQTQRLIVRNKSSGPQKRCVVHWSVVQ